DGVADLDVVKAGNLEATFKALADLAYILLEALQGLQPDRSVRRRIDDHAVADNSDLGRPLNDALRYIAARDRADSANLEGLANIGPSQEDHFLARLQLAFQGRTNVVRE